MQAGTKFSLLSYERTFSLWFLLHWTEFDITAALELSDFLFFF